MFRTPHGYYKDVIIHEDGTRTEYPWRHNQIQNNFAKFMSGLTIGHNFGGGVGVGVNQIAYGSGLDEWYTAPAEPQSYVEGGTAARLYIPDEIIFPLAFTTNCGLKIIFDGSEEKTIEFGPYTDPEFTIVDADDYWADDYAIFDALLAGNGVQGRTEAGVWYIESLTTGPTSSIEIASPMTIPGVTSDLFGSLVTRFAVGEEGSGGDYPVEEPSLNTNSNILAAEFGTQVLDSSNFKFVDPTTLEESTIPTRYWQCTVIRDKTVADEIHGEFGLYGAYNSLTNSRLMLNWVARPTRITKRANDRLETTVIMTFFQN
jgi:hypothetical protein